MITPLTILEIGMWHDDELFLRSENYTDYLESLQPGDEVLVARWGRLVLERVAYVENGRIYAGADEGYSLWTGTSRLDGAILPPGWNFPLPGELTPGLYWEEMMAFRRTFSVAIKIAGREVHIYYLLEDRLPLFARVGVCYPQNGEVYKEVKKKLEYYFSRQYRHTRDLFEGWTK